MASKADIEKLVQEAKPLWLAFRARANRPNYEQDIRNVLIAIADAEAALNKAGRSISKLRLDTLHGEELIADLKATAALQRARNLVDQIIKTAVGLKEFGGDVSRVTSVLIKKPPNRPQAKYVSEVLELMRFYEQKTRKRTLFPKRIDRKTEEANQDSTEFVYQCLRRIDPEIKLKQVISAIRNALIIDKQVNELLRELRVK
jgi:hypothetical protein